jgi:hypothetical protein
MGRLILLYEGEEHFSDLGNMPGVGIWLVDAAGRGKDGNFLGVGRLVMLQKSAVWSGLGCRWEWKFAW